MRLQWLMTSIAALNLTVSSCSPTPSPVGEWTLNDGRELAELVDQRDTVALLIWDPAECFVCRPTLQDWIQWGNEGAERDAALILTRQPTPAEKNVLIVSRLTYQYWLAKQRSERIPPSVYLFVNGVLTDSVLGHTEAQALLNHLRIRR